MIYENIRRLCDEQGLSVRRLEVTAGLGNGTISNWRKTPKTVKALEKVAKHLGVTVDALLK
jgi:transcriptional regulator with XRE-family HTH domain